MTISLFIGALPIVSGITLQGSDLKDSEGWDKARERMIHTLKTLYNVNNEKILSAMEKIRRHLFIPPAYRRLSDPYGNHPCSIGHNQTISQPFIVARMTELLSVEPGEKILEVGTGSGYQAAILAELGAAVYSVEIVPGLAEYAKTVLSEEGYPSVNVINGNGWHGLADHSPFNAIIVTCAPDDTPPVLLDQLAEGGRMVIPVGANSQQLIVYEKKEGQVNTTTDIDVRFVPMVRKPGS